MSLAAGLTKFKARAMGNIDATVSGTVAAAGERVVTELSPVGDPALWERLPSGEYHPGNFRGNWFYSAGSPSRDTHNGVGIATVNGLGDMPTHSAGLKHFVSNSLEYAQSLEYGHSSQAPAGIIAVIAIELPSIAEQVARKVAA